MANFVDVVGYQLEKVHTGVLAWLFDSASSPLPLAERVQLAGRLAPQLPVPGNLSAIRAFREYSFGRRLRIDLVLQLQSNSGPETYILIECKTDSDVTVSQLEAVANAFAARNKGKPYQLLVLAIGAGQFTLKHQLGQIHQKGYQAVDLESALRLFSRLPITDRIYDDWIASLQTERRRTVQVNRALAAVGDLWDQRLTIPTLLGVGNRRLIGGYRLGFPVYYMYYGKLRKLLERFRPNWTWAIYSGANNPVMNWEQGWVRLGQTQQDPCLYWEFNSQSLCLKAHVNQQTAPLSQLIGAVVGICSQVHVPIKGRVPRKRGGTWVTIYKWDFDFCTEPLVQVAQKTIDILTGVHDQLKRRHSIAVESDHLSSAHAFAP